MDFSIESIKSIAELGGIGIALVLILMLYRVIRENREALLRTNEQIVTLVKDNTKATAALEGSLNLANQNQQNIIGVLDRNTRAFIRVEKVLEKVQEHFDGDH